MGGGNSKTTNHTEGIHKEKCGQKKNSYETPLNGYAKRMKSKNVDFTVETLSGVEKLQNYGILPLRIFHEIFLHLELKDLFFVIQTCKLFRNICQSNLFWKDYFNSYFELELNNDENNIGSEKVVDVNWKRKFYNVISDFEFVAHDEYYVKELSNKSNQTRTNCIINTFDLFDRLLKVLIVGDIGVGKTSLLLRYTDDVFNEYHVSTIGVDFKIRTVHVGGSAVRLQIWDTAGQERFRTITSSYYKGSQCMLVCFALDNKESFERIEDWMRDIRAYGTEIAIQNVTFVGCKSDLKRKISRSEVRKKLKDLGVLKKEDNFSLMEKYVECSAKKSVCCTLPFGLGIKKYFQVFSGQKRHNEDRMVEK